MRNQLALNVDRPPVNLQQPLLTAAEAARLLSGRVSRVPAASRLDGFNARIAFDLEALRRDPLPRPDPDLGTETGPRP